MTLEEKFKKEHSNYILNIIKKDNSVSFEIEQDWIIKWWIDNFKENKNLLNRLDVVEHDICRELHFIRGKAGKNQLKLIAEITHAIRKVFNNYKEE